MRTRAKANTRHHWLTLLSALLFSLPTACTQEVSLANQGETSTETSTKATNNSQKDEANGSAGSSTPSSQTETTQPNPEESAPTTAPEEGADTSSTEGGPDSNSDSPESSKPEPEKPEPKTCEDGAEINCEERESGEAIVFPGGVPQGSCKYGTKTCSDGEWSTCKGAIPPSDKDTCELGNDDNCNGRPTDHCACSVGETQECGSDVGACEKGTIKCLPDGTWSKECEGEVKPTKEICDGKLDENCDGKPDEENCECINGTQRPCGDSDVGACRFGTQTCSDGKWGRCQGAIGPRPERCDGKGIDEDCDGAADEADTQCDCNNNERKDCIIPGQRGDCQLGVNSCVNGRWGQCRARFRSVEEVCGTLTDAKGVGLRQRTGDEDCDGLIDESDASNNFMPKDPLRQGRMYMLDEDGDGWGALGREGEVIRRYCNSQQNRIPRGYRPLVRGRENSDCGDCPGTGMKVNPGFSGEALAAPNACLREVGWGPGAFDYNCQRGEELQYTKLGTCSVDSLGPSCRISGDGHWSGSVPQCGEEASWVKPEQCTPLEVDGEVTCIQDHRSFRKTQTCK